jgi:hypothetical protein
MTNVEAKQLAWMEGRWRGEYGADPVEEHWSGEAAGTIMGMFRWIKDGEVSFYELLTIEPEGSGQLEMRIKHFHPGLRGWEEKDESLTFDLVELREGQAAWLKRGAERPLWLVYRRTGDQLAAWFVKEGDDTSRDRFVYGKMNDER